MIKHIDVIDSTSRYLMDHPDWFDNLDVISASHQTAGLGRTGHSWVDNHDENVLFSIIIKDKKLVDSFKLLSISMGVIILDFLKGYMYEDNLSLKWPNDVMVKDKKICGILLQGRLPDYVVIGVGLNVNQAEFKGVENATSLSLELGKTFDIERMRTVFIEYVVSQLKNYDSFKNTIIENFNNHNYLLRKEITYFNASTNSEEEGIALGINDNGELLVSKGETITPLSSSEVSKIK